MSLSHALCSAPVLESYSIIDSKSKDVKTSANLSGTKAVRRMLYFFASCMSVHRSESGLPGFSTWYFLKASA